MTETILDRISGGLIVSCQALIGEPLHGPAYMAAMARAAEMGGAVGIRANGPADIAAIRRVTTLPIIGIYKKEYENSQVYITPTMVEVDAIIAAGCDLIAVDATQLLRPDGQTVPEFLQAIRKRHKVLVMGDVSTSTEGVNAQASGVDLVSTTLAGYTHHSPVHVGPDFALLRQLTTSLRIPVVAEGRVVTPEECAQAFALGAFAVVVGGAITRPQDITRRFAEVTPRVKQSASQGQEVGSNGVRDWN